MGLELGYGDAPSKGGKAPVVVVAPTTGGPAEKAGIRPGDAILAVDGREVTGLSLYEVGGLGSRTSQRQSA